LFVGGDGQGTLVVGDAQNAGGCWIIIHSEQRQTRTFSFCAMRLRMLVGGVGAITMCPAPSLTGVVYALMPVDTPSVGPQARRHGKCEMQTARSLERTRADRGERRCLRVPAKKTDAFYPPNHGFILSVKFTLLVVYAHPVCKFLRLKIQPCVVSCDMSF
jgi:hypothetical protein